MKRHIPLTTTAGFKVALFTLIIIVSLSISACQATDILASGGLKSFEEITLNKTVSTTLDPKGYYRINTPSGEFLALSTKPDKTDRDIYFSLSATEFISAGLKVEALPEGYSIEGDQLILYGAFSDKSFNSEALSATSTLKYLIQAKRDRFGYHHALDHYGIGLGNGNMFEWAKDLTTNDKDLVFVLDPTPFMNAGVDIMAIQGWVYADVEVMDEAGKKTQVKKLLKPFDLP